MVYRKRKNAIQWGGWTDRRRHPRLARLPGVLGLISLLFVSGPALMDVPPPSPSQQPTVSSLPVHIAPVSTDDQVDQPKGLRGAWQLASLHILPVQPILGSCYPDERGAPDNDDTTLRQVLTTRQDRSPPSLTSEASGL